MGNTFSWGRTPIMPLAAERRRATLPAIVRCQLLQSIFTLGSFLGGIIPYFPGKGKARMLHRTWNASRTLSGESHMGIWAPSALPAGQVLRQPAPLFKKLDESVVEEEYARLEG